MGGSLSTYYMNMGSVVGYDKMAEIREFAEHLTTRSAVLAATMSQSSGPAMFFTEKPISLKDIQIYESAYGGKIVNLSLKDLQSSTAFEEKIQALLASQQIGEDGFEGELELNINFYIQDLAKEVVEKILKMLRIAQWRLERKYAKEDQPAPKIKLNLVGLGKDIAWPGRDLEKAENNQKAGNKGSGDRQIGEKLLKMDTQARKKFLDEVYESLDLAGSEANNKVNFIGFTDKAADNRAEDYSRNLPESFVEIRTFSDRGAWGIDLPEDTAWEDLDSDIKAFYKTSLKDKLQAKLELMQDNGFQELVVQSPFSGGGIGTVFLASTEDIEKFVNIAEVDTPNTDSQEIETLDSWLERSDKKITQITVTPRFEQTAEPSVSFGITDNGKVDPKSVILTDQVADPETKATMGIRTWTEIPEKLQEAIKDYVKYYTEEVHRDTKYTGPCNLDFGVLELTQQQKRYLEKERKLNPAQIFEITGEGEGEKYKILVAAESNARYTSGSFVKSIIQEVENRYQENLVGMNYDHLQLPKDMTLDNFFVAAKEDGIPIFAMDDQQALSGIAPLTTVNPTSGEFGLIFLGKDKVEVEDLFNRVCEFCQSFDADSEYS